MAAEQGDLEARVERLEKLYDDLIRAIYASIVLNNPDLVEQDDLVGLAED